MKARSAVVNVARPYLSISSPIRRAPTRADATPAHRSPWMKSGSRLLTLMISTTDWIATPSETSFTAGRRRPSWKISVASFESEPGTMPPTSFEWAMFAVQAITSSSAKTGIDQHEVVEVGDAAVERVVRDEDVPGADPVAPDGSR